MVDRGGDRMSYWDNICAMQKKQTEKGIATYGQTLEQNDDLSISDRITLAEEEMIDMLMYMEHIKAWLKQLEDDRK